MADRDRRWGEDRYGREPGFRYEDERDRGPGWWEEGLPGYRGYLPDTFAWPHDDYVAAYGPGDYERAYGRRERRGPEAPEAQHRGKGPKNYTRSDDRIREDVSDRMWLNSWLDASDIEVAVMKGEVTLSGTVQSREEKRRAEDIAESVPGVTHVQNNLRVGPPMSSGAA